MLMSKEDVDDVVLFGGSSRIPKVREMLKDFFNGKELCQGINPDEAVAHGAAIQAAVLSGAQNNKSFVLEDVIPLSLGLESFEGNMNVSIPRNTTFPTQILKEWTTSCNYQTSVSFCVYEGERPIAKHNNFLGMFELHQIPRARKGKKRIDVCFDINDNGILTVSAQLQGTKNKNQISITNHGGKLSKEEIDRMVNEANNYKAEDEEYRKAQKAKLKLQNYVDSMWDKVKRGGKKVAKSAAKMIIEETLSITLDWIDESDCDVSGADEFEEQLERLQSICDPLVAEMCPES